MEGQLKLKKAKNTKTIMTTIMNMVGFLEQIQNLFLVLFAVHFYWLVLV